jgi:nucleoside-diphosphate-sugar epimerase
MFRALRYGLVVTVRRPTAANLVFVEDLVRGILLAARSDRAEGEIFNLADSENMGVHEAMRRIASALGKRTLHVRVPVTLGYAAALASELKIRLTRRPDIFNWMKMADLVQTNWTVDIGKARRLLGYEPRVSIDEGGALTYRWYEKEGWI